ncbi:MAG: hypothetical protein ACRDWE_02780 [Acidimicrobiales bacterium]
MAEIVLGIGTSHTPLLSLPPELWERYASFDLTSPELVFPPEGQVLSYEEAVAGHVANEIREKPRDLDVFRRQYEACNRALDVLAEALVGAEPDITIVISDDQDEWFYEGNMPALAVYWGASVPLIPRRSPAGSRFPELAEAISRGYGESNLDVPVPSSFGRFLIEQLIERDFDVAQMTYVDALYGGEVTRRYPGRDGETQIVRKTPERPQGLPHGFAFVVKRLFDERPRPLLPVIQNTCYPPNAVTPSRCFQLGRAIHAAVAGWHQDVRVAIVASGGLSHFVVDEELDRTLLGALGRKDAETLRALPRHRLYSGSSESLNWVTAAGVLHDTRLEMELVDYVPVYRTEAGTGGGWAFARWH